MSFSVLSAPKLEMPVRRVPVAFATRMAPLTGRGAYWRLDAMSLPVRGTGTLERPTGGLAKVSGLFATN